MTRDEIYAEVSRTMIEMFEVEPDAIKPGAKLYEDLDLDSIDAIDMAVKMQEITGQRVEEKDLRKIRTVDDVVDLIDRILRARA